MSNSRGPAGRGLFLGALALVWALSCSDSSKEALLLAKVGEGCTLNSECASPLVCAFQRCHVQCEESRDCPTGQRCVHAGDFNVCQLPDEEDCARDQDCEGEQSCAPDRTCRDACQKESDCVKAQLCVEHYCADASEVPDGRLPEPSGGAPGAGGSNSSGGMNGSGAISSVGGDRMTGGNGAGGDGLDADGCPKDLKNCDRTDPDCETAVDTQFACGACDTHCESLHGTSVCQDLSCVVPPGGCQPLHGDCDLDGRNGCETPFADDRTNCGACGRVCEGGGPCTNGMCGAVKVVDEAPGESWDFTFVGDKVFFLRNDGVHHADISPATLPTTSQTVSSTLPRGLTADNDFVYWIRATIPVTIRRFAVPGIGPVESVNDGACSDIAFGLKSTATALYFGAGFYDPNYGSILAVAKGSNLPATPIVSGRADILRGLVLGTSFMAWNETDNGSVGNIYIAPLAGGSGAAIRLVAPCPQVNYSCELRFDNKYLYWNVAASDTGSLNRFEFGDPLAKAETVALDLAIPQALLLDDKYLYTSEWGAGAKLSRFSKTPPKAQETIGVFYQYALVHVDDKFIWLTADGDLYRTPK